MKKLIIAGITLMLAGCSYYNKFYTEYHTATLNYQCGDTPLVVTRNNATNELTMVLDDKPRVMTPDNPATNERYTDGEYVFWQKEGEVFVQRHDTTILKDCQLQPR